ncbi:hypothetical protein WICMUC_003363 [Wickerhamomyces mucosus]|uniref:Protein MTH1 n=1 Tax=Wickerhamomyces mucosus TaxID=1378264 RepID=A0A9P8PMS5_9ASCO|nr:hypothetical protein WICMUC_003363 [Wickerhamomyces mucosus]
MYVSPYSKSNSNTPKEYKNRARDEITRKLNLNKAPSLDLRHGSSPLKIVSNASDSSLSKVNSNESIESIDSIETEKSHHNKKLFGLARLKQLTSSSSRLSRESNLHLPPTGVQEDKDVDMKDSRDQTVDQVRPSNASIYSNVSSNTYQPSIFSTQHSLTTQFTNISLNSPSVKQPQQQSQQSQIYLTLQQALPTSFEDIYLPELLSDPNMLIDGRPSFTKRPLIDWDLNDIRSLLIVSELKPEWNFQIPIIYSPQGFKMEYLPLNSNDELIIKTLVSSDIYKESKFDMEFRIQTAKYTVYTARTKHAQLNKYQPGQQPVLSKPEWRNIIENFMLNLAVESQCRYEFKKHISDLKSLSKISGSRDNNLLKKALLKDNQIQAKLTKEQKFQVWKNIQSSLYNRLGLDWKPDN